MDRNAASNRSIRMKHGTTVLHVMELNLDIRFRIPEQNALQASSSYVPAQWRSPSSIPSLTVPTPYSAQVPKRSPGIRFSAPPYNFPPPYITLSNMSTTSRFPKRSQYPIPPYVPPSSCPPYTTQSSIPVYTSLSPSLTSTSQSYTTSIADQTSRFPKRSQYPTPPYVPPSSCPPYTTQSFMPVFTSFSPSLTYSSQSSIRSSASVYSSRYPTPTNSTEYSVPTYTSRSSTSTDNLSPSLRMDRRPRARTSAYTSYSHYTFRSTHYTMPQLSMQDSDPSSMDESSINVWPTEIGSVMQASMENIYMVLTIGKIESQLSATAREDFLARRVNGLSLECINPKPSDSTKTASNSCAINHNEKSEKTLMPLFKNDNENIDTQLRNAWVYFNKLEIVDIEPNGKIKCICPMKQFEDLLKLSINDKRILVNLHKYYEFNNILFETKYDYNSSPQNTIVTEKLENEVLQWLISLKMEQYGWFFNSLSLCELENISPTNIQKFIMRSKSNNTILLEDQLKICCIVKTIKEWPVSLMAIAMALQDERIDDEPFTSTVIPYLTKIFLFPMSIIKHFFYKDIMKESLIHKMIAIYYMIIHDSKIDIQPDTNFAAWDII